LGKFEFKLELEIEFQFKLELEFVFQFKFELEFEFGVTRTISVQLEVIGGSY
jgi:hypothetical protein